MRNVSIDIIKVILSFFVVLLHFHLMKETVPVVGYITVNGLFRIAVPFFLFVSGWYFTKISSKEILSLWILRVLKLYLFWSIFYFLILILFKKEIVWWEFIIGYGALWYLLGTILAGAMLYLLKKVSTTRLILLSIVLYYTGYSIQLTGLAGIFGTFITPIFSFGPLTRNFLFLCFPLLSLGYCFSLALKGDAAKIKIHYSIVFLALLFLLCESLIIYSFLGWQFIDFLALLPLAVIVIFFWGTNKKIYSKSKFYANFSTSVYVTHWLWVEVFPISNLFLMLLFVILTAYLTLLCQRKIKFIL